MNALRSTMREIIKLRSYFIFFVLILGNYARADIALTKGWNLVGNGQSTDIAVSSVFNDTKKVTTVWKWDTSSSRWAFYTPLQTDGGAAYAVSKGYDSLSVIHPGEGFWVNSTAAWNATVSSASQFSSSNFAKSGANSIQVGWNLIAIGDSMTAAEFNASLAPATSNTGAIPINVTTLWAWDAEKSSWYFYAPNLEAQGGSALQNYISNKGYLDFTSTGKKLGGAVGFWVNVPDTSYTTVSSNVTGQSTSSSLSTQVITMSAPSTWVLGTPVTVTLGTSSGLSASLSTTTTSVCTVNGTTVTLVTLGKCTLVASQSGNSKYLAASDLTQSFNVISDIPPLIPSISNIANLTMTVGDPILAIGSTSNLQTSSESAPVFSNGPLMAKVQDTTATVTWVTDKPSLSGISWSDSSSHGSQTETKLATNHAKVITGLKPNTSYQLFLTATDGKGNGPTISSTVSFTTTASTSSQATLPQASTMANCDRSKNLIGANDTQGWNVLSLTTAPNRPACILAMQDAGKYIVVSVKDIYDSNGLICDLVVIAKKTGATTCINVPLTYRSKTGNPEFSLGDENFLPGQLTPDGKYFAVVFTAGKSLVETKNREGAYMGYLRLDFSATVPSSSIAYLMYSPTPTWCNYITTINGGNITNSSFWLLPNGDLTFSVINFSECDSSNPAPTPYYYYMKVDPKADPLNPGMTLFNVGNTRSSVMNPNSSPLAKWILTRYPDFTPNFSGATLPWASESSGIVSFYVIASGATGVPISSVSKACPEFGSGVLVKININTLTNAIDFEDLGATTIGAGYGNGPNTNNIFLEPDGKFFTSMRWSISDAPTPKVIVSKLQKTLDGSSCETNTPIMTTQATLPNILSDDLFKNTHDIPFTYSTDNYVFMLSYFSNRNSGRPECSSTTGCQIGTDALVVAYNKKTGVAKEVPLSPLVGKIPLSVYSTFSNPVNDELRTTLYDKAGNMYFANISSQGVSSNIKFPQGFSTTSGFVNFATPPSVP